MLNFLLQFFGLVLLSGGVWFGYRRWIAPRAADLDWQAQGLLLLVVLTLMGGAIGSPFWFANEARSFSWDLPPLASRMLAAAAWAFVVVCYLTLERPTRHRLRLTLLLLFVYLAPLALAIVLFHLDRFDATAPITYAFFAIVGLMIAGSGWYLWRQPPIIKTGNEIENKPSSLTQNWLLLLSIVIGFWGAAIFITDSGPTALIWLWPGDLLSSRLIGVMLLAIASGALYGRRSADAAYVMLITIIVYAVGIVAAGGWNALAGRPLPLSYLLVFGLIALLTSGLLFSTGVKSGG